MQLLRADANFRTKAKLVAISKAGGGVNINGRRIHRILKELRRLVVICHNTFTMASTKFGNVLHGLLNASHNLDGQA